MTRYALVVPFPELAPVVDGWRERTCVSKPSNGVPPHVTLLVPCPGDVAAIGAVLDGFAAFDVTFGEVGRFSGAVWLAPEPVDPFRAITAALVDQFPDHPPYDGAFAEVIPHLTVAQADLDKAEAAVRQRLPQRARAREALLLEEVEPQQWRGAHTFPLAGA